MLNVNEVLQSNSFASLKLAIIEREVKRDTIKCPVTKDRLNGEIVQIREKICNSKPSYWVVPILR